MPTEHCLNNGNMLQQKISRNPEQTLKECCDIHCHDKTKGRLKKECRDISKIVATKAGKSSKDFVMTKVFMLR